MIGQHKRDLTIVPYQSGWVELFEQEADRLRNALGENALRIEHIGSTSIPGMMAKPIIDMMAAVESLNEAAKFIPVVEALGYEYKPHDTVPERKFFAKEPNPEIRSHHLNLAELDSGFWKDQIAFRDYLRKHKQMAVGYVELKKRLAEEYGQTGQLNLEGKTPFVTKVLELVEQEERAAR